MLIQSFLPPSVSLFLEYEPTSPRCINCLPASGDIWSVIVHMVLGESHTCTRWGGVYHKWYLAYIGGGHSPCYCFQSQGPHTHSLPGPWRLLAFCHYPHPQILQGLKTSQQLPRTTLACAGIYKDACRPSARTHSVLVSRCPIGRCCFKP